MLGAAGEESKSATVSDVARVGKYCQVDLYSASYLSTKAALVSQEEARSLPMRYKEEVSQRQ